MKAKALVLVAACWISACNGQATVEPTPVLAVDGQTTTSDNDKELVRPGFHACVEESDGSTPEMQACMSQELVFHEHRMKTALDALAGLPTNDAAKRSQAEWKERVNKECSWDPATDGEAMWLEADYCRMTKTAARANELEVMLGRD